MCWVKCNWIYCFILFRGHESSDSIPTLSKALWAIPKYITNKTKVNLQCVSCCLSVGRRMPSARRRSLHSSLRSSSSQKKRRLLCPTNSAVWSVVTCWTTPWSYPAVETATVTTVSVPHTHTHTHTRSHTHIQINLCAFDLLQRMRRSNPHVPCP